MDENILNSAESNNVDSIVKPLLKTRDSNIELFRIVTMIMIIAHHYVVNSGLFTNEFIFSKPFSINSIFLILFGTWGKTGINCFVLITGYFMCKSNISLKKFLKLFLEFLFYKIVIAIVFWIFGIAPFNLEEILKVIIPVRSVASGFVGTYLLFFLTIPFVNILVKNMTEKQHLLLILLTFIIYVVFGTIPFLSVSMNYVSWFIVLYFIASYIKLYPKKLFENTKFWLITSIISIILSVASIFACLWAKTNNIADISPYNFVQDSNTFLALTNGLCLFMLFKNLKVKQSKFINKIASTMFGVLLIHANSDAMRQFLWVDLLKNVQKYTHDLLILHAICSVLIVFIVCIIIDLLRIKFVEKPFFKFYDKIHGKIVNKYKKIESKICTKFNIKD